MHFAGAVGTGAAGTGTGRRGLGFVLGTVVVGGDVDSKRALTLFAPADPTTVHVLDVPADAQRPPQPANREPACGVAVSVTRSPARSNSNAHVDVHELPSGGSIAARNATVPLPPPVSAISARSRAAAAAAPESTSAAAAHARPTGGR
jgi:hypothetical protein